MSPEEKKSAKKTKKPTLEEKLYEQLEQEKSLRLRAMADLENFRRREAETRMTWGDQSVAEFWKSSVSHLLTLDLGKSHTDKDMQKSLDAFFAQLEKQGLARIQPNAGDPVDPHQHEVMMAEEGKKGCVVRVLESGWKYKDVVIAPAKISGAQN